MNSVIGIVKLSIVLNKFFINYRVAILHQCFHVQLLNFKLQPRLLLIFTTYAILHISLLNVFGDFESLLFATDIIHTCHYFIELMWVMIDVIKWERFIAVKFNQVLKFLNRLFELAVFKVLGRTFELFKFTYLIWVFHIWYQFLIVKDNWHLSYVDFLLILVLLGF